MFKALTAEDCRFYPASHFSWLRKLHFHFVVLGFVKPFTTLKYLEHVQGQQNEPKTTPFVVVSNHVSLMDPPLIGSTLTVPVAFMAKKELFANPIACWFFKSVGTFAIDRENTDSQSIKTALNVLKSKYWALGLFPEGTRSTDGSLKPMKKGAMMLAQKAKVPILPIGIVKNPATGKYRVNIGQPIDSSMPADDLQETTQQAIQQLCNAIKP